MLPGPGLGALAQWKEVLAGQDSQAEEQARVFSDSSQFCGLKVARRRFVIWAEIGSPGPDGIDFVTSTKTTLAPIVALQAHYF